MIGLLLYTFASVMELAVGCDSRWRLTGASVRPAVRTYVLRCMAATGGTSHCHVRPCICHPTHRPAPCPYPSPPLMTFSCLTCDVHCVCPPVPGSQTLHDVRTQGGPRLQKRRPGHSLLCSASHICISSHLSHSQPYLQSTSTWASSGEWARVSGTVRACSRRGCAGQHLAPIPAFNRDTAS
jgi:hypothetical protein